MGAGYYLGDNKYSGWIIEKESMYNRDSFIENLAYTAGDIDNIYIKASSLSSKIQTKEQTTSPIVNDKLQFEIVDYSEKAIALFGDTRAIKDLLKAMGGKFKPRLTHNEEKKAGWIFSKTKQAELETIINLNN